ncbi:hypothetical protein QBC47DRAFT_220823 [Echria macrotheca]|uniref:Uncharacterized protein n=1 Tax=Echria macrotheca TaxID=438768 RepID=A0AAJ0F8N8_9PEZI|nr:hypothetical protein QBC47DRAFT_220823 [Echria macrotheca]
MDHQALAVITAPSSCPFSRSSQQAKSGQSGIPSPYAVDHVHAAAERLLPRAEAETNTSQTSKLRKLYLSSWIAQGIALEYPFGRKRVIMINGRHEGLPLEPSNDDIEIQACNQAKKRQLSAANEATASEPRQYSMVVPKQSRTIFHHFILGSFPEEQSPVREVISISQRPVVYLARRAEQRTLRPRAVTRCSLCKTCLLPACLTNPTHV